jgi:hypothetical protein
MVLSTFGGRIGKGEPRMWISFFQNLSPNGGKKEAQMANQFDRLLNAIECDNFEQMDYLWKRYGVACLNPAENSRNEHPLIVAANKASLETVRSIFRQYINYDKDLNSIEDEGGNNPLHYSVRRNDTEMTRMFLEAAISPNHANNQGRTAIFEATYLGNKVDLLPMLNLLLEFGARVDIWDEKGNTLLHAIGAAKCDIDVAQWALNAGADPTLWNRLSKPAYEMFDESSSPESIRRLLEADRLRREKLFEEKLSGLEATLVPSYAARNPEHAAKLTTIFPTYAAQIILQLYRAGDNSGSDIESIARIAQSCPEQTSEIITLLITVGREDRSSQYVVEAIARSCPERYVDIVNAIVSTLGEKNDTRIDILAGVMNTNPEYAFPVLAKIFPQVRKRAGFRWAVILREKVADTAYARDQLVLHN